MNTHLSTNTAGTIAGTVFFDFGPTEPDPVEELRKEIRAAIAPLGRVHSTYMAEHHGFDGTDCDVDLALEQLYNLICGLPRWAHLGETKTAARINGRKCRKIWRQHGLRVGDPRKKQSKERTREPRRYEETVEL